MALPPGYNPGERSGLELLEHLRETFVRAAVFSGGLGIAVVLIAQIALNANRLLQTLVRAAGLAGGAAELPGTRAVRAARGATSGVQAGDLSALCARVPLGKGGATAWWPWARGNRTAGAADAPRRPVRAVLCTLPGLGSAKEGIFTNVVAMATQAVKHLHARGTRIAQHHADGDVLVLGWDHPKHGSRKPADGAKVRWHANRKDEFWSAVAQSAQDVSRMLDWCAAEYPDTRLSATPGETHVPVLCLGFSMGGDVFVTAATLDQRVTHVLAVIASPNWLRPGSVGNPGLDAPFPSGDELYERMCPFVNGTRLKRHRPVLRFLCGDQDDHVPPACADGWVKELQAGVYADCPDRLSVTRVPGVGHGLLGDARGVRALYDAFPEWLESGVLSWRGGGEGDVSTASAAAGS